MMKILLVEDVAGFSSIFAEWLQLPGIDVDVTCSGTQALLLLQANSYDLAFIDVHLPDLDAVEMIELALSRVIALPRLFAITGDGRLETREACLKAGFVDVLVKPILHSQFIELIQQEKAHHDLFQ